MKWNNRDPKTFLQSVFIPNLAMLNSLNAKYAPRIVLQY